MKTNLTYLFVGDVLGAYKAIYHSWIKLSPSRNLNTNIEIRFHSPSCTLKCPKWPSLTNMLLYLLNVNQLSDVHVIVAVPDIWPHCLDHLADDRHNDVAPGKRQWLTVEQLLQQCHHVTVIGGPKKGAYEFGFKIATPEQNNWYLQYILYRLLFYCSGGFSCCISTHSSLSMAFFSPFSSLSWSSELWCQPRGVNNISFAFSSTRRLNKDSTGNFKSRWNWSTLLVL